MNIDNAYEAAKRVFGDAEANIANILSEEDAKFQLISRVLIEVLGWAHADVSSERPNANGFSDYILSDGERPYFVLEAKKIGAIDLATKNTAEGTYKISGPVLKPAFEGIAQAAGYCHPLGVQLAVLTDGRVWIVFLPWVPNVPYAEKQAIVFPSFQAITDSFGLFYELLAKDELKGGKFRVIFDRIHENRLVLDRALESAVPAQDNRLIQKSHLAFDLEKVFESFFSELAGDDDPDMLIDCFVETRESRIADFSLEKITKNVLGNIDPETKDIEAGLQAIVQGTVAGDRGQTVFIVGPSGAGKSTFLDRFFARTLDPVVRERCVVVDINALDASGDNEAALAWMTQRAIELIEGQLFPDGAPAWNDLQGLYQLEYVRRAKGVDALLYERDKPAFKEKFASYVDEQVERDREGYLRRLLRDIVKNRKLLPVFVIDNTDEFPISFKTMVFQYFQSLRREADHCLIIFPATDKSAWAFSKTDIFNIYSSRSFFLPTPSPREVFRKRIEYLKLKLNSAAPEKTKREYFTGRGIRVTIGDLTAFAAIIEGVFVDQDYAAKRIGELSNYNMRQTLGLCRRVITSATLKIEDLVRSYVTETAPTFSITRFMNALLKGDYAFFKHGDEPLLFPIFQVDSKIKQSPLIHMRLLLLLREQHVSAKEDQDRYLTVSSIFSYFDLMGLPEVSVQASIQALLAANLIEPYDASRKEYAEDQSVAITYSGVAHYEFGMHNSVYFEQMAMTTRIVDPEVAAKLTAAYNSNRAMDPRLEEVRSVFAEYMIEEDIRSCAVPSTIEFKSQFELREGLASSWIIRRETPQEGPVAIEILVERVKTTVDWFDRKRGFGFVNVASLRDAAFLHIKSLEDVNADALQNGDELICDIAQNDKGFVVVRAYNSPQSGEDRYTSTIVKLLADRQYGFMHIPELGVDAFFHFNLFDVGEHALLAVGQKFLVEIATDQMGRSQVRRVFA